MPNEGERALGNTTIRRKAATGKRFRSATDTVFIYSGYSDTEERQLWLRFETSASGGSLLTPARTDYRILIGTDDYATILKAMCDVDEDAALSAMADELATRLKPRP